VTAAPPSASLAAAIPATPAAKTQSPPPHRPSASPRATPFRGQANAFLRNRSNLTPVISVLVLLVVILIPCAAAAVTRYRRLL
jgi:hypothetical protein